MTEFLFGLGLLFVVLGVHPYIIYPATLKLMKVRAARPFAPSGAAPSVSICISVYNEERVIAGKIASLLAMAEAYVGDVQIGIYIDGAIDGTAAILAPYADRINLIVSDERRGKTAGLNLLVSQSKGEILVFTDANVQTATDGLSRLIGAFADPEVGCASARLVYANPDETAMSATGAAYWNREERIKDRESRTFGVIGVDGAFFGVRRQPL